MLKVETRLGKRSYAIIIGHNILNRLGVYLRELKIGSDAFIITNNFLKNRYGKKLSEALSGSGINLHFKIVPDSEKSKSIQTASRVIAELAKFGRKKRVFIIAFGGGVIGDLAGFVASIYRRGTDYIQIPTTLLAQVDSAIGGKTALDLDAGKNLIGAFYQPKLVFSDIEFLKSLNQEQLCSGMAEVIKYAVIKDKRLFCLLESKQKDVLAGESATLKEIISSCSKIKAEIISRDEKETLDIRTLLNFGHTIGHAIEAAGGYKKYNHGQAVGLGMIAAVDLSEKLNLISAESGERIKNLIRLYRLPSGIKGITLNKIIQAHYHDKKFSGEENKFVLIRGIGKPEITRNIPLALIKETIKGLSKIPLSA